jgi:uncharacterized membrane protein required for colicin V production
MAITPIDFGAAVLLLWGGYHGYQRGLSEMLWPAARWILILTLGAVASGSLGSWLQETFRTPILSATLAAYIFIGSAIAVVLGYLRRRFSDHLSILLPWGQADHFLGCGVGILARAAALLVVFALLNPLGGARVNWNPGEMSAEEAVRALGGAVLGSLSRAVLIESWSGRFAKGNLAALLIASRR